MELPIVLGNFDDERAAMNSLTRAGKQLARCGDYGGSLRCLEHAREICVRLHARVELAIRGAKALAAEKEPRS